MKNYTYEEIKNLLEKEIERLRNQPITNNSPAYCAGKLAGMIKAFELAEMITEDERHALVDLVCDI